MNPIKKVVCTLNIDDYAPEICKLTYPLMRKYAEKIGADFRVIKERKFPGWPVVYEKLQIGWLAEGYDWSIYFDGDALIHPETIDYTTQIPKDTVLHNGHDMANVRWKYDEYFLRDGRNIGSCNWFTIASDWTRKDLYRPLDIPLEKALENINPIPNELKSGITREHLIDDYTLSRNIARYGLKFKGAMELQTEKRLANSFFFYHQYTVPIFEKVRMMKRVLDEWDVDGNVELYIEAFPRIQGWMDDKELQWLFSNAREMNSVVEVGCWKGHSTHALASGCKGTVYAVDNFRGSPDEQEETHAEASRVDIRAVFEKNALPNTMLLEGDSAEIAKRFKPKSIDIVFIDGDHSREGFRRDYEAWKPVAKKLLCGHDNYLIGGVAKEMGITLVGEVGTIWSTPLE